jgi:hypothetical protein
MTQALLQIPSMNATPPSSPGMARTNSCGEKRSDARHQPYRRNEKRKVALNKLGNLLLTASYTDKWGTSLLIREVPKDMVQEYIAAQKGKKHEDEQGC